MKQYTRSAHEGKESNLRSGFSFAVADAYEQWGDLGEKEVIKILQKFKDPD